MEKNTLKFGLFLLTLSSVLETSNSLVEGLESARAYDYTKYHPMDEFGLKNPEGKEKKVIWMDCGIHAREWIAPAFCQWFVKEIVSSYKTNAKLEQMLQNLDVYVTPVINVDGYMYTWVDNSTRLWRKSRSDPPPNRPYGTDEYYSVSALRPVQSWHLFFIDAVGVSFDSCSNTYCGISAGSEPEAKAVMDIVGKMHKQILCFLTIHSAGQLILLPYGHPEISAPNYDELVSVGKAAAAEMKKVHGMDYTVGTSPQILYANSGSSRDWARLIGIPFSYTFELRDKGELDFHNRPNTMSRLLLGNISLCNPPGEFSHLLPEEQIQPACEEAFAGALSIITYVHDKAFNSGALPNAAGLAITIWSTIMVVSLSTGVLV
ncbi:Carboxypeptidase O [Nibea albiflora]|uniref:Carboxypeptidase O n=1 Tax=Nibea albiflora TaxID=240163 RepID=A0ACB7EGA6_NIBAL|nr:Carboxypeptidase O [Nibea albiflora]